MVRNLVIVSLLAVSLPGASRILVHGHRGARAERPENTLAAFEYAIEVGADVLELDLSVTKDDVLVVSHDPVLNPSICEGPLRKAVIRELTLKELSQWDCGSRPHPGFPRQRTMPGARIPTLDEVFALASRGDFQFNIETKIPTLKPHYAPPPEEFAQLVWDAIRRHGLESRAIVQSFDFRTLRAMRKLTPEIRLAALFAVLPQDFVRITLETGASIVSPEHRLVSARKVRAAHEAGLEVVPWTANKPKQWDRLIKAGVNGIITDDPAGLIRHLKEHGAR